MTGEIVKSSSLWAVKNEEQQNGSCVEWKLTTQADVYERAAAEGGLVRVEGEEAQACAEPHEPNREGVVTHTRGAEQCAEP